MRRSILLGICPHAIFILIVLALLGCQKPSSDGVFYGSLGVSKKLIIASSSTVSASPYIVAQYSLTGQFEKVLFDLTLDNRIPRSLVMIDPFTFLLPTDTVDGILKYSFFDGLSTFVSSSYLSGNIFESARASNGDLFVIESNNIESFDSNGNRIGNPRIATTIGSCTLSTARGMAIDANGTLIVASQGNDDILFYDVSDRANTTCLAANQTLGNVDPVAIVAHSDGFVYVAHSNGTDSILKFNGDGSGSATTIFSNTTIINNPTAMIALPDGTLLVASDATNNIIRIDTSGNVLDNPFIQNGFTTFVQSMMVLDTP